MSRPRGFAPFLRTPGALAPAAGAVAARLGPFRAAAGPIWDRLLETFLGQIEPLLTRLVPQRRAVIVAEGEALVLYEQVGRGSCIRLGLLDGTAQIAPSRFTTVDLRLPADQMLRRSLSLPMAGRAYLQPIIAHRLERLTPWRMDKVVHGFAVSPDERTDGTIAVDLLATSADRLGPVLERLTRCGFVPTSLGSAEDPLDAPPRIDLYAGRSGPTDRTLRRRVGQGAVATIAVLAVACLASAWVAQDAETEQAETTARLTALRSRIQAHRGGATSHERDLIAAHRAASALVLIDALSDAIPDNTVLREMNLSAAKVRLAGRSGDAPALIKQLEGKGGLTGVRFAAPVVRDAEGRDLFEITAGRPAVPGASDQGGKPDQGRPFRGAR